DLRFAVVAADEAGVDLPRLVRPVLEDGSQVRTHALCLPSWHGEVLDPGPRSVRSYRACCLPPVAALGTPRTSSATLMARKISWIGLPSSRLDFAPMPLACTLPGAAAGRPGPAPGTPFLPSV